MKFKNYVLLLLLTVFSFSSALAQIKTVSGTVTEESGSLPGVSIIIKGTTSGTETDFDGKYTIEVNVGDVLVFSFVGMSSQERIVGAANVINVVLSADNVLEEIIVTGQGSGIQKRKLSTTVDVLSEKDIDRLPAIQIDQLLQSTTPSAQIRLSSGQSGTVSIIRTRGSISAASSSTPVVIVDGIRVDNLNSNPSLGLGTGGAIASVLEIVCSSLLNRNCINLRLIS